MEPRHIREAIELTAVSGEVVPWDFAVAFAGSLGLMFKPEPEV